MDKQNTYFRHMTRVVLICGVLAANVQQVHAAGGPMGPGPEPLPTSYTTTKISASGLTIDGSAVQRVFDRTVEVAQATSKQKIKRLAAKSKFIDLNKIITSLAPIEYLPEHNGQATRSVDLDIPFAFDSADILPAAQRQLDELAVALASKKLASDRFQIIGHTDARGDAGYNRKLSSRRAASVKNYLVGKRNIATARLEIQGLGEDFPKNPFDPEAIENRRVEIKLISVENASDTSSNGSVSKGIEVDKGGNVKVEW